MQVSELVFLHEFCYCILSWFREALVLVFWCSIICYLNFCIALSHWCIFHQSKAELVVGTWDKQFHNSEKGKRVPLLYLANDILQNSKRKGNEFVTEFWKVLPKSLKDVLDKGEDHEKRVASRLVSLFSRVSSKYKWMQPFQSILRKVGKGGCGRFWYEVAEFLAETSDMAHKCWKWFA